MLGSPCRRSPLLSPHGRQCSCTRFCARRRRSSRRSPSCFCSSTSGHGRSYGTVRYFLTPPSVEFKLISDVVNVLIRPVYEIRLRYWAQRARYIFSSKTVKDRFRMEFMKSLGPVGEDPIRYEARVGNWAGELLSFLDGFGGVGGTEGKRRTVQVGSTEEGDQDAAPEGLGRRGRGGSRAGLLDAHTCEAIATAAAAPYKEGEGRPAVSEAHAPSATAAIAGTNDIHMRRRLTSCLD